MRVSKLKKKRNLVFFNPCEFCRLDFFTHKLLITSTN